MTDATGKIFNVAICPHCGNKAAQNLVFSHEYEGEGYDAKGAKTDEVPPSIYYVAVCSTCDDLSVYNSFVDSPGPEEFSDATLVYPKPKEFEESVPDAVREAYTEASRIREIAPNAYAVMLRRSLEALCDDRGVSQGSLQQRLGELVKRGELPPTLAEMTFILRILGNAGAHHGGRAITIPMTWEMEDFFRAVVEYVYIAPRKLQKFKKGALASREEPMTADKKGASVGDV
jgi:hypothetical protein